MRADFDACANSISFCLNLFLAPLSESVRNKIVPNKSDRGLLLFAYPCADRGACAKKQKTKKSVVGLHLVLYGTWFKYMVLYIVPDRGACATGLLADIFRPPLQS